MNASNESGSVFREVLPDDGGQLALDGEEGHGVEHVDFIDGIVQVVDGI